MKSALSYRGRCENEASRRLYRGAIETAQRLDHSLNQITDFINLFSPEITDIRTRLKDYCERLMFTDPVAFGKKAEDLLWRKVYYEFFQKCKQNKKKLVESEFHQHTLRSHLLAAIGSYHHMLLRIQTEFHLDLDGKVDVPFMWHLKGVKKERWKKYQQSAAADSAIQAWANQACHHILTYLGDLARYISELQPDNCPEPENSHLAQRYYLQAFSLNPKNGIPHNQLGSLANNRFDSAYHYMRCLASFEKFDAAEGNLIRIFEKNNHVVEELESDSDTPEKILSHKRFLAKFLKLCEIFYFSSDENLQKYCQEALQYFDMCMLPVEENLLLDSKDDDAYSDISFLDDEVLFKVIVMCMMCVTKLHERGSSDVSTATAFTLALFSSIVHSSFKHLHSAVYETILENTEVVAKEECENSDCNSSPSKPTVICVKDVLENKNKMNEANQVTSVKKNTGKKMNMKKYTSSGLRKLRRRRKISSTSQEDSEISDVEVLELAESDEENGALNSDVSRTGSCSSESLSEHEDLLSVEQNNLENESLDKCENDAFYDEVYIESVEPSDKFIATEDNCNKCSQGDKVDKEGLTNGVIENILPSEKLFEVLSKSCSMLSMKVLVDWLRMQKDLLTLCSESLQFLLSRLIEVLNLMLNIESELLKAQGECKHLQRTGKDWKQLIPLPEDILLQELPALENIHSYLCFDVAKRRELSQTDQVFFRVQCLLSFGDLLSETPEPLLVFDKLKNEYSLKVHSISKQSKNIGTANNQDVVNNDIGSQRQQLMHEMAHLWLKSEVNKLERSIKSGSSPQLSPLLVADTSALCNHLPLLKQLIAAKSFVIIVPKVVIDNLDQLKKKSSGAREAIRWLEFVFQKGSRHIRAQRDAERTGLHPIKYPKRKDKESWDYFQILECCHFLVQQQQQSSEKATCTLVTLLFGVHHQLPGNAAALARSLDLSMESIENFFTKWRSSTKKPG